MIATPTPAVPRPLRQRRRTIAAIHGWCLALLLGSGGAVHGVEPVVVFAAASTAEVMSLLARRYQDDHGVPVTCSFAASSTLAKQIIHGAPADLFLSADQSWMDHLAQQQAIAPASRTDLLANTLVFIAPTGTSTKITVERDFPIAAAFRGRLAVGDPTNVPAGRYAKEAFTTLGWWEVLSGRLAPMADVRAALTLVEVGEADLGVVYATDAQTSTRVTVVATITESLHTPIRYPVALTTTAKPAAAAFLAYLRRDAARAVFKAAGFRIPVPTAP